MYTRIQLPVDGRGVSPPRVGVADSCKIPETYRNHT